MPQASPTFLEAMASCHSITRIHGDIAGDPLDCKMFEFTKWELHEPNQEETENFDSFASTTVRPKATSRMRSDAEISSAYEIGIIKQFPFSSSLQRMSVVVRVLNQPHFVLYCKGSPEKIAEMSKPDTCKLACFSFIVVVEAKFGIFFFLEIPNIVGKSKYSQNLKLFVNSYLKVIVSQNTLFVMWFKYIRPKYPRANFYLKIFLILVPRHIVKYLVMKFSQDS